MEALIAEARYGALSGIFNETVQRAISLEWRQEISERIDAIILNRYLGFPLFLLIMFAMFQFVFTMGEYPMGWIEGMFKGLAAAIESHMAAGPLRSLLVDGIIGGVGGVLVFLPNILLLFFAIGCWSGAVTCRARLLSWTASCTRSGSTGAASFRC